MKRLLITLVILTGLLGSAGAVWADALSDFDKGLAAYKAGKHTEAAQWYRKSAEQCYFLCAGCRVRGPTMDLDWGIIGQARAGAFPQTPPFIWIPELTFRCDTAACDKVWKHRSSCWVTGDVVAKIEAPTYARRHIR